DWAPVKGRDVVIWPDNDEPGRRYGNDVAECASKAGARSVRIVEVPRSWPEGWDVADQLPEGVTAETLWQMLEQAPWWHPITGERSPASGPDMSIIQRTRVPAPTLDLTAFGPWADWITKAAASKAAPVDYIALALLSGVAGVIGATRLVSPWDGWAEPAILW